MTGEICVALVAVTHDPGQWHLTHEWATETVLKLGVLDVSGGGVPLAGLLGLLRLHPAANGT